MYARRMNISKAERSIIVVKQLCIKDLVKG